MAARLKKLRDYEHAPLFRACMGELSAGEYLALDGDLGGEVKPIDHGLVGQTKPSATSRQENGPAPKSIAESA